MRRHRRMVGHIIQQRLMALSQLSRAELDQLLGRPAEHLVMGDDQRPYLMTSVVMRRPDGSIWAHVYVATGGWDEVDPVIRSAALTR
ncbi:MAG TPA: hypothetical protein VGJ07_33535 [Rugosimonospora sp.]